MINRTFKEILDTRSRLESKLRDVEEKLEEMDAKFEHNIAAMNELLQKNLKYLKHLCVSRLVTPSRLHVAPLLPT